MICDTEKIQMPLPLASSGEPSGESQSHPQKSPPRGATLRTPEAEKEYHRRYYQTHKSQFLEYSRAEYHRNIERYRRVRGTPEYKAKASVMSKEWREKNYERRKASMKRWVDENSEWISEYRKAYGPRRRELYQMRKVELSARSKERQKTPKARARIREYCRKKRRDDVQFAIMDALRASTNRAFRRVWIKKPARTEALLGCTIAEAKAHIEAQFVNGMTWTNRASFVLDHHIPIAAFDLRDAEEVKFAFNWRNLQPLTRHDNAVKSDTLPSQLPSWLPGHIAARIVERHRE